MPAESLTAGGAAPAAAPARRTLGDAGALLVRAAAPERRHLLHAVLWLLAAAGLEALGPLAGKFFIDEFLLPREIHLPAMAGLGE